MIATTEGQRGGTVSSVARSPPLLEQRRRCAHALQTRATMARVGVDNWITLISVTEATEGGTFTPRGSSVPSACPSPPAPDERRIFKANL